MDGLSDFLIALLGVFSCSHVWISGSELEATVRPGNNITLYCDCKTSSGFYIVWFRNCSHENQPSLVLRTVYLYDSSYLVASTITLNPFPHLYLVKNHSSDSYDLLIVNITESSEGLYYCGTEQSKFEIKTEICQKYVYRYGNTMTRLVLNSSELHHDTDKTAQHCGECWTLLFSLCPAFIILPSLLSSLLVYQLCQKEEPQDDERGPDDSGQIRENQDEDVCYTTLEFRQPSKRPKKEKTLNSDFSTYTAINTSRV